MSDLTDKLKQRYEFRQGQVYCTDPILSLLIEAVEALEDVLPYYNPKDLGYISAHGIYNNAEEVLSRLRKELGE